MNPQPKKLRQADKAYLKYIKSQKCLVSGLDCIGEIVCHHTKTRATFGADYLCVSLCIKHHLEVHAIGKQTFQDKYGIDYKTEIVRLLKNYPKQNKQIVQLLKELEVL